MLKSIERLINEAIYATYTVFSARKDSEFAKYQIITAMKAYMRTGTTTYFTRTDDARDNIEKYVSREDMAMFLADYLVNNADKQEARTEQEQEVYYQIAVRELVLEDREKVIKEIADILMGGRNTEIPVAPMDLSEVAINLSRECALSKMERETEELRQIVENTIDPQYGVSIAWLNRSAINYCRNEVRDGTQIKIQNDIKARNPNRLPRREYNLNDELMATTDIGVRRSTQQDSVLVLYYPGNPKYKMLVVADGVGGTKDGHLASAELVRQMSEWFETLNSEVFQGGNEQELFTQWNNKLLQINSDILQKFPGSASTFVGGIVGEKTTMIASVGDSRAYAITKDNQLHQITSDDNNAFEMWEDAWNDYKSQIERHLTPEECAQMDAQKDNLRFHQDANVINQCFGMKPYPSLQYKYFRNDIYKTLMLFSDGVTDCLSDSQIMAITRRTNPKDLASAIVNAAITTDTVKQELASVEGFYTSISGGKDNTTAAIYDNTKYQGDER